MEAVDGDFYEFMAVDEHRTGILVADVTGHGVPAAIIAAMIRVAMQSLLHGLNRILSPQLGAQFISALCGSTVKIAPGHIRPPDSSRPLLSMRSSLRASATSTPRFHKFI
jgi:hypothetical protein